MWISELRAHRLEMWNRSNSSVVYRGLKYDDGKVASRRMRGSSTRKTAIYKAASPRWTPIATIEDTVVT
jgi:hypothetical protein